MNETTGNVRDRSGAAVRPPIAWALAAIAGLALDWLYPLPFLPAIVPAGGLGGTVFLAGLVPLIWAAASFRRAGTQIQTTQPTTREGFGRSRRSAAERDHRASKKYSSQI